MSVFRFTREELAMTRGRTGPSSEDFCLLRPPPGTGLTWRWSSSSSSGESSRSPTCGPGSLRKEEKEAEVFKY